MYCCRLDFFYLISSLTRGCCLIGCWSHSGSKYPGPIKNVPRFSSVHPRTVSEPGLWVTVRMSVRLPLRSADVSWKLRLHIPCLCVQHEGMRIHPRTTSSLAVAFAQLVAPFARRPLGTQPLFKSSVWHLGLACSGEPAAAVTTAAAHASGGDDGGVLAISRQERKRARKTRSFRRRQAPITRGQRRTLRELWPKYGLVGDFNSR